MMASIVQTIMVFHVRTTTSNRNSSLQNHCETKGFLNTKKSTFDLALAKFSSVFFYHFAHENLITSYSNATYFSSI